MFLGQGGRVFSGGVEDIARRLRVLGIALNVFKYTDVQIAHGMIDLFRGNGYRIVFFGYSLGTSTVTYLQGRLKEPCDLLLCVAMSKLESDWKIDHSLVRRSVLWHGPGILSSAGTDLGFDQVIQVPVLPVPLLDHLLMPDLAMKGVVAEVMALKAGEEPP
jgi:hypothetical protein